LDVLFARNFFKFLLLYYVTAFIVTGQVFFVLFFDSQCMLSG